MNKKMMTKILTALVLIACVVPPFLLGGIAMEILIAAITIIASVEISSLEDGKRHWVFAIVIFIAVEWMTHVKAGTLSFAFGAWLISLFLWDLLDEKMTTDRIAYTFIMTIIIVLAWHGVWHIYQAGYAGLGMLFVSIACYGCDTGAYFFGLAFGKHKMNPRISPNKTWEGAVGGYLLGLTGSLLFGWFVQRPFAQVSIPGSLMLASSFILPAVAEIGDLSFSSIKRRWGIKDYGSLLPGHGGILDRVDSLLFCLMVFNGMMILWEIV